MLSVILGVVRSPAQSMRQIVERGALPGFVTVAAWVVVSLLAAGLGLLVGGLDSAQEFLDSLPPGAVPQDMDEAALRRAVVGAQAVGVGLRSLLWPFAYWAVLTLVMHLISRFFGGVGSLAGMFGAMGVACLPFVVSGLLQLPIMGAQAALGPGGEPGAVALGAAGALISLAALILHVALVVVGASAARGLSYGGAAGSCAVSCAAVFAVPLLALALVAVVLILFGGGG